MPPSPVLRSGKLEAVTRTCLTQTGPSLASNSFSTLRGSPLMSLDGTAIPFGHLLGETGSCVKRLFFVVKHGLVPFPNLGVGSEAIGASSLFVLLQQITRRLQRM